MKKKKKEIKNSEELIEQEIAFLVCQLSKIRNLENLIACRIESLELRKQMK